MSDLLEFDENLSAQIERTYTTDDVVAQRRALRAILALQSGEHVLDIGSGPGFLAAEMAEEVGETGRVVGVDPAAAMLAVAAGRRPPAHLSFQEADALALPFPDGSFDAITSTQVYEYVAD